MSEATTPYGSRPAPTASSFELFAWYFMRVSGVILLALALGHLFIMHLLNNVGDISYQFVSERWGGEAGMLWRSYDWLMLFLALVHGLNGLRTILNDYLKPGQTRVLVMTALYVAGFIFLTVGSIVILTFQPVMGSGLTN